MELNPDGDHSVDFLIMEEKLARVRKHINSKLDNQKKLALILTAVEENLDEQKSEKTPVAYFVSFLSLLDQSVQNDKIVDVNLATAAVYFLEIIFPFTPKTLLVSKFSDVLAKLATPLTSGADAPLVKSTIGALEYLLLAQDYQKWSSAGKITPKRAMAGLLEFALDPRPKVRRKAQEAVNNILSNPPASPSPTHVASALCGQLALERLASIMESSNIKNNKDANSQIIHCLQLIAAITSANAWPKDKIEPLCDVLLEISRTNDQYLVSSAFSAFEGLFQSMSNVIDIERFATVLHIIIDLKPPINDTHLAAPWLAVVAKACESFSSLDSLEYLKKLPNIIPLVSTYLASEVSDIYTSASNCLVAFVEAIPNETLLQPTAENGVSQEVYDQLDEVTAYLGEHIEKELLTIKYQVAFKEILEFVNSSILKLRTRANPDFLGVIEVVGEWRTNESENFPHNREAEDVLASAISVLGPEVVLGILPLNLTSSNKTGRAWLLPLLRDNVRFANLSFYKSEIWPAIEFFEAKINENPKDSTHAKIFQTIIDQVWSLLPHFCDLPIDLQSGFDDAFAAKLSDIMYASVDTRGDICHALRLLVESNLAYSEGALQDDQLIQQVFPIEQAKSNLEYLGTKAANILSVLFNIFSSTVPDSRGFVLETIDAYLQIIPKQELENTFNKVCGLFKNAIDEESNETNGKKKNDGVPTLSLTMMDLLVAMSKYVPASSHNALFSIFTSTVAMEKNALMQKRSYRIISKLGETEAGRVSMKRFITEIVGVLVSTSQTTHISARASRLSAIQILVELLEPSELYFIPSVLQEIILSTKDVNERSRSLSYRILIDMGNKMKQGGIIINSKVPGFGEDAANSEASLTEYLTMVSGGLAAEAPHMISATITALSCLVFEFKDDIPVESLVEICQTVELFLTHNGREIAKSAIGFVKVEVLSLPEEMVRANLNEMLTKLMRWSHEHKGHFKSKVKHIVERLIRKFGVDLVEQAIPEEDRKLVTNIKKTRARNKRKQTEDAASGKSTAKSLSAYEDALNDSDVSDDEDGEEERPQSKSKATQFIMESGDNPLDLLDRQALASISSSKPKKTIKRELADKMKTKNGKFVFSEQDDPLERQGSGIDAYLDAVKQQPVRGQKNRLKFKKIKEEDYMSGDENENEEETRPKKSFRPQHRLAKGSKVSKPKQKFKARKKL